MEAERKIADLSPEDREELLHYLRDAVYHLTSCWDALKDAEDIFPGSIETDDIQGIAGSIGDPSEAYRISLKDFVATLEPAQSSVN